MEQNLEDADFAVMVCTKRYVEKANAGKGGVGYEKMIMTSSSLNNISDNKVIPIIRENGQPKVPTFLKTKLYIDFTKDEEIEFALDELLRVLLNAPLFKKSEIGKNPFRPLGEARPDRTSDGVREVMTYFVRAMNRSMWENIGYKDLIDVSSMPRLMLDKYFKIAMQQGLVTRSTIHIHITDKGIQYAEDNGIIDA